MSDWTLDNFLSSHTLTDRVVQFLCYLCCLSPEADMCLSVSNPCFPNSQCVDIPGSYVCQCQPGWTGADCKTGEYSHEISLAYTNGRACEIV
jgi:hypothetical protein